MQNVEELTTYPFDENLEEWGIALVHIQANVPDTIPGQAVTPVMMGDASIANAVMPETAFTPVDPIMITTMLNTALRSEPSPYNNSRILISAQTSVPADGISEDGRWLRVVYQDRAGWILRAYTDSVDMLLDLPVLNGQQFTPMQAFYLRTKPGTDHL